MTTTSIRENLRLLMLEQPQTEERNTYSDGFANGLAYAIERLDKLAEAEFAAIEVQGLGWSYTESLQKWRGWFPGFGEIAAVSARDRTPEQVKADKVTADNLFRERILSALSVSPREEGKPVAWVFELARAKARDTGEYCDWSEPRLSFSKPCVPDGSIRNLRPLYALSAVGSVLPIYGD